MSIADQDLTVITDAADAGPAACGYFPTEGWSTRFAKRGHEDGCDSCADAMADEQWRRLETA